MGYLDRLESWLPAPAAHLLDEVARPIVGGAAVPPSSLPPPPAPPPTITTTIAGIAVPAGVTSFIASAEATAKKVETAVVADVKKVETAVVGDVKKVETAVVAKVTKVEVAVVAEVKRLKADPKAELKRMEAVIETKALDVVEAAAPYVAHGAVKAAAIVTWPLSGGMQALNELAIPYLDHLQQRLYKVPMYAVTGLSALMLSSNFVNRPPLYARPEPRPDMGRAEPGVSAASTGNEITTLVDGDAYKKEILKQIADAKVSIWFEAYEWQGNELGTDLGDVIANALIAKKLAHPEMDIRVITDNRTNFAQAQHLHKQAERDSEVVMRMRSTGIKFSTMVYIRQVDYSAWRLNHRKLSIFDGTTAFVGGQNIGSSYLLPITVPHIYHDETQRFRGPVVYDVASVFADSWYRTGGEHLTLPPKPMPLLDAATASTHVQIVRHRAGLDRNIERELVQRIDAEGTPALNALSRAAPKVVLENGYGMSDLIFDAVMRARKRNVEVVWLWGEASPDASIMAAKRFDALKAAGVSIRAVSHPVHMKAYYTQQGSTLLQGSSNMDGFSTVTNDECDAQEWDTLANGRPVAGSAAKAFYDTVLAPDIAHSPEMTAPPSPSIPPTRTHRMLVKILERVADGDQ